VAGCRIAQGQGAVGEVVAEARAHGAPVLAHDLQLPRSGGRSVAVEEDGAFRGTWEAPGRGFRRTGSADGSASDRSASTAAPSSSQQSGGMLMASPSAPAAPA
jgi:hypothetical protein